MDSCGEFFLKLRQELFRFKKEVPDGDESHNRRKPGGDGQSESFGEHDESEEKDRIHRAVFEIHVFFYILDIVNSEVAHNDGAEAVADENERDGESESESAEYAVNGKCRINDFEVEELTNI